MYDLDIIKQRLQAGEEVLLYYVASFLECREELIDEHMFKSVPYFNIIEIKCTDVVNAYYELLEYYKNPDNYHVEQEITYTNPNYKYIKYYTVKNKEASYDKDFTSSMPSIIYGKRRKLLMHQGGEDIIKEFNSPSPVKPIYTNNLEYGDLQGAALQDAINNGSLDWKYMKVDIPIEDDGIEYFYITSDYYILDIQNFPRTEKPLINVKDYSAYFLDVNDAYNYKKQLEA